MKRRIEMSRGLTYMQWMKAELAANGLFDSQVEEVVPLIVNDPLFARTMTDRWNDSMDGYPEMMKRVLWLSICHIVLAYIDRTCPQAWFRAIFDLSDPVHKMTSEELTAGIKGVSTGRTLSTGDPVLDSITSGGLPEGTISKMEGK
jgi:hypothetical protein